MIRESQSIKSKHLHKKNIQNIKEVESNKIIFFYNTRKEKYEGH